MGVELKFWTEGNILNASAEIKKETGCQNALTVSIEHPVIGYLRKLESVLSPTVTPRRASKNRKEDLVGTEKEKLRILLLYKAQVAQNDEGDTQDVQQFWQCDKSRIYDIQRTLPAVTRVQNVECPTLSGQFDHLLAAVEEGLSLYPPELCEEGVNGTYFLKDKNGRRVAVFKPEDEQGDSEHNPKSPKNSNSPSKSTFSLKKSVSASDLAAFLEDEKRNELQKKGLLTGEVAIREVSASLLDREGFYGVPKTCLVMLSHSSFGEDENGNPNTKFGSLQEFIENDGAAWDVGCNAFPVKEVHKIGVLDLHIFNTDRHEGNILIKTSESDESSYTLTPIDHGYSLPHSLDAAWFDWLTWSQAKRPFDKETLDYIERINIEEDIKMLEQLGIRKECLNTMKISTMLLKKGAKAGLTLFEIGDMVCRRDIRELSDLEIICNGANELMKIQEHKNYFQILSEIMDEEVEKKVVKRQRCSTM